MEKSQAELLEKVKHILTDDEFKEFKAAVERQRPGREGARDGNRAVELNRDNTEKK